LYDAPGEIDAEIAEVRRRRPGGALEMTIDKLTDAAGEGERDIAQVGRRVKAHLLQAEGLAVTRASRFENLEIQGHQAIDIGIAQLVARLLGDVQMCKQFARIR
jgi:hypothetical protein